MRFDILTIFPEFFAGPLDYGIVRRARQAGLVEIAVRDLRDWTRDRHRTVDDRPFGGGEGMVLKPEPVFEAVEALLGRSLTTGGAETSEDADKRGTAIVLLSAAGKLFRQDTARRLAALGRVVLICGRYEGVDERVAEHLASDELSIGDFVLSGGELAAAAVLDAVTRLLPGVLGNEDSAVRESFSQGASSPSPVARLNGLAGREPPVRGPWPLATHQGILDCPHYTRPAEFRGWKVPEALISGHHAQVARWRRKMALAKTARNRPDLLAAALAEGALSAEDLKLLDEIRSEAPNR